MTECIKTIVSGIGHWETFAKDYLPLKSIETQVYSNLLLNLGKICLFIFVVFVVLAIRKKMPYKVKKIFNCILPVGIFIFVLVGSAINIHKDLAMSIIGNNNTLELMLLPLAPAIIFALIISFAFIFLRNK